MAVIVCVWNVGWLLWCLQLFLMFDCCCFLFVSLVMAGIVI